MGNGRRDWDFCGRKSFFHSRKIITNSTFYSWNFAADLIIQGRQNIESTYGIIIGIVTDYCIGMSLGILIGLLLKWSGAKYYLIKGIGTTFINWMILGVITQLLPQLFTYKITPLNWVTYICANSLVGGFAAYSIVKLSQKSY
jgi:hypothetical protein